MGEGQGEGDLVFSELNLESFAFVLATLLEKTQISKTDRDPATAGFRKLNKPCPYTKFFSRN